MKNTAFSLMTALLAVMNESEPKDPYYVLAQYFLYHFDQLRDLNIYDVADACYVSRSGIRRFCQSIGFDNFSDLKAEADEWKRQCNYFIGHFFGRRIIQSGKVKALTPERLAKTEGMIEKWGPLAVFLGRFFPFIRTFMPFISGISGMRWSRFTPFSVLGGLCWSTLFTLLGYFFGNIPAVQDHFELVIVLILLVSLAPTIIGLLKAKFGKKKPAKVTDAQLDVMEDGIKNLDK